MKTYLKITVSTDNFCPGVISESSVSPKTVPSLNRPWFCQTQTS